MKAYLSISGFVFALVALLHFVRAVNQWLFQVGPWSVPTGMSWVAGIFAGLLSILAFRLLSGQKRPCCLNDSDSSRSSDGGNLQGAGG